MSLNQAKQIDLSTGRVKKPKRNKEERKNPKTKGSSFNMKQTTTGSATYISTNGVMEIRNNSIKISGIHGISNMHNYGNIEINPYSNNQGTVQIFVGNVKIPNANPPSGMCLSISGFNISKKEGNSFINFSGGKKIISGIRINGTLALEDYEFTDENVPLSRKKDGVYIGQKCILECELDDDIVIDHIYNEIGKATTTINYF